jgi:hypothetical protein
MLQPASNIDQDSWPEPQLQRHYINRVLFCVTVQGSRSEEGWYGRNKEVCAPRL